MKKLLFFLIILIPFLVSGCAMTTESQESKDVEIGTEADIAQNNLGQYVGEQITALEQSEIGNEFNMSDETDENTFYTSEDQSVLITVWKDDNVIHGITLLSEGPYNVENLSVGMPYSEANALLTEMCTDIQTVTEDPDTNDLVESGIYKDNFTLTIQKTATDSTEDNLTNVSMEMN